MTDPASAKALTPKLQALAKRLLLQLHMVLKTARLHDPHNQALLVATENLKDSINTLWAAVGVLRLQFVDDVAYLNDVRVRLDTSAAEQIEWLRRELSQRGMGGLSFVRPVDTQALRDFIIALARPVESEEDAERLKSSLLAVKDLALEILGPRTFADTELVEEIRIDKRTFALQTYSKALVAAREAADAMRAGKDPLSIRLPIVRIVQDLIDIGTERINLLLKLSAIKHADTYLSAHAANTCVTSIVLGRALGVERLELVDLGTAAFVADLGFGLLPPEALDRPDFFTPEQRAGVISEMLAASRALFGDGHLGRSAMLRVVVAFEHHRHFADPETKRPAGLHLFSRIVAVADAYDALTTIRPWRSGYAADEALRFLSKEAGTRFDPVIVKTLTNLVGLYPLGSAVVLDSGEIAVVYHNSNDPRQFDVPFVRVVRDAGGALIKKTTIRNLAEHQGAGSRIVQAARAEQLQGLDPSSLVVL